jgi:hypothetical protein
MITIQNHLTADEIAKFLARAMRFLDACAGEGIEISGEEDPALLMLEIVNSASGPEWAELFDDVERRAENIVS